jgi:hypothetical protein
MAMMARGFAAAGGVLIKMPGLLEMIVVSAATTKSRKPPRNPAQPTIHGIQASGKTW